MYKKQGSLFDQGYMINDNGNEAETEQKITQIRHKETGLDMDINILNIKFVSV